MEFENMVNKIINGNCYEIIKKIPDNSIDLILTDPPYDFHCGTINKTGIFKRTLYIMVIALV